MGPGDPAPAAPTGEMDDGDPPAESNNNNSTVAQLHQTLVVLRKELELKNQMIREFKAAPHPPQQGSSSSSGAGGGGPKSFEEIFEPLESGDRSVIRGIDVDQIMLFEDLQKQQEEERERTEKRAEAKRLRNFRPGPPVQDPIRAFVISEDEEEEAEAKAKEVNQAKEEEEFFSSSSSHPPKAVCSKLQLVPNEHIVIHPNPSHRELELTELEAETPCSTPDRPVLRSPTSGSEPRSCSGSQTDITAIELKNWHSEPYSLHKKVSMTAAAPAPRRGSGNSQDPPHSNNLNNNSHLQRSISSGNDRQHIGRYSILNRDFSPKFGTGAELSKVLSLSTSMTLSAGSPSPSSVYSPSLPSSSHLRMMTSPGPMTTTIPAAFDEDLNALLFECGQYLKVAQSHLVTARDWSKIDMKKSKTHGSQSVLRTVLHHQNNSSSGRTSISPLPSSFQHYPYVPHSCTDLRVGNVIRFILTSALVNGIVRYVSQDKDVVGVETQEKIKTISNYYSAVDPHLDWRKHFKCVSGDGLFVPMKYVVMCVQ